MRSRKRVSVAVFLCSSLMALAIASIGFAAEEDDDEFEYEEHARVMRISLLSGEVSLRRAAAAAGNSNWERARLNMPLVEGDTLTTGRDARLEIQADARNFVRVGADSVLRIVTLRDEGIALSLVEGTASLRLAKFEKDREYVEIDAPKITMAAERPGAYRLDVARNGGVRIVVRDGGRARIYSETSGFTLREKRSSRLIYDGDEAGDWELGEAPAFDEWDQWNDSRERFLASRLKYDDRDRYYDRDVWGAEELDLYGDWINTKDYGWVWRPHVTVINRYSDWSPYRYGHWTWCPPYGWTWVADEEWGWATYHYGRWVYYNNSWCWSPRGYGYKYKRSWWRPALVAFVYIPTSHGEQIAWYPLRHGQRDPRGRWWRHRPEQLQPLNANEIANIERTNPAYLRAVSTAPVKEFGAINTRARPATNDIARRAFTSEPVRGRLPITPNEIERNITNDGSRRARSGAQGASPITPARPLPERATGAAARMPGLPLDNELRRVRVFRGRKPNNPSGNADATNPEGTNRPTGAIARPPRVRRPDATPEDGTNSDTRPEIRRERRPVAVERRDEGERDAGAGTIPVERPPRARPPRSSSPAEERPIAPPVNERENRTGPVEQPAPREAQPTEERPMRRERPERLEMRREREERREERREMRREQPEPRREQPSPPPPPRQEQPAPPPPRQERHEPPPTRAEPPARSDGPAEQRQPERDRPARPPGAGLRHKTTPDDN